LTCRRHVEPRTTGNRAAGHLQKILGSRPLRSLAAWHAFDKYPRDRRVQLQAILLDMIRRELVLDLGAPVVVRVVTVVIKNALAVLIYMLDTGVLK